MSSFYYIRDIKDHHINKEKILSVAYNHAVVYASSGYTEWKNFDIKDRSSIISNTDYKLLEDTPHLQDRWVKYAFSERDLKEYQEFLYHKFKVKKLFTNISWFNQYYPNSGSEHWWHNHSPEDLTNIYFVELKDKSLRTILKHPKTGKEIVPKVKEGQMLTFDGRIQHMSPPNHTSTRKTVISFNIRFLK